MRLVSACRIKSAVLVQWMVAIFRASAHPATLLLASILSLGLPTSLHLELCCLVCICRVLPASYSRQALDSWRLFGPFADQAQLLHCFQQPLFLPTETLPAPGCWTYRAAALAAYKVPRLAGPPALIADPFISELSTSAYPLEHAVLKLPPPASDMSACAIALHCTSPCHNVVPV